MEPRPPALGAWSLSHRTTREAPSSLSLIRTLAIGFRAHWITQEDLSIPRYLIPSVKTLFPNEVRVSSFWGEDELKFLGAQVYPLPVPELTCIRG